MISPPGGDLDLHVVYCTMNGAEAAHDPEFGATVKWDISLLDGYPDEFPHNGDSTLSATYNAMCAETAAPSLNAAKSLIINSSEEMTSRRRRCDPMKSTARSPPDCAGVAFRAGFGVSRPEQAREASLPDRPSVRAAHRPQ
jgi:hypothetical protein